MAAHPQLSESEAQQMAKYILSLADDAASLGDRLAHQGTYPLNKHKAGNLEGKYILTATYTDRGGEVVGPLTAREMIVLQSPKMLAGNFKEIVKAQKFRVTPEMSEGFFEQEMDLVIGANEGYVMYEQIDFTGIKSLKLEVAKAGTFFSGGKVTLHLDDIEAPVWVEIPVETNLVDFGMEELITKIPNTEGIHDFYVKFSNDGEKPVTALISILFSNEQLNPKS